MNAYQKIGGVSPLTAVRNMFGLTIEDLRGKSRKKDVAAARQLIVLAYDHLGFSYEEIGVFLNCSEGTIGGRLYSARSRLEYDKHFKLKFDEFKNKVNIF